MNYTYNHSIRTLFSSVPPPPPHFFANLFTLHCCLKYQQRTWRNLEDDKKWRNHVINLAFEREAVAEMIMGDRVGCTVIASCEKINDQIFYG
jgi:hypothetical protein